jgi:hypothetical protein
LSHPSYAKGYRFEKKCQAWLVHLGGCARSMMSRGSDLTLTRNLREWKFSCKAREKSICKMIDRELETHDGIIWGYDRGIPIVAMPLPKLIELVGEGENLNQYVESENQYLPNGTEGA